jgi:hypothetical protein
MKIIKYQFEYPNMINVYKEQEDHNKALKYSINKAPEIYNYKLGLWEIYVPYMLNYVEDIIHPQNINDAIYNDLNTFKGYFKNHSNKYSKIPFYIPLLIEYINENEIERKEEEYHVFIQNYVKHNKLKNILNKILKDGKVYTSNMNDYIKDGKIMVRPDIYTKSYDLEPIRNNFWILENNIQIIE